MPEACDIPSIRVFAYRDEFGNVTIHRDGCGNLRRIQTAYSSSGRQLSGYSTLDAARKASPTASLCGCLQGRKAEGLA